MAIHTDIYSTTSQAAVEAKVEAYHRPRMPANKIRPGQLKWQQLPVTGYSFTANPSSNPFEHAPNRPTHASAIRPAPPHLPSHTSFVSSTAPQ